MLSQGNSVQCFLVNWLHQFLPSKARFEVLCILLIFVVVKRTLALNDEGHALIEFARRLNDPSSSLQDWNSSHSTPCRWAGITDLSGKQLKGNLTLAVTRFIQLKVLNLSSNKFRGDIPLYLGNSASLRLLNLSDNCLEGTLPRGILPSIDEVELEGNNRLCEYPTNYRSSLEIAQASLGDSTEIPSEKGGNGLSAGMIAAICVAAFVVSKIILLSIWYCRRKKMRSRCEVKLSGGRMIMFQLTGHTTPLAKALLRKAEKLKPQDIIGSGGYGTVYKLVLDDMSAFAVKKLTRGVLDRDQGFERELQTVIDIRHRNLLTLRGYYSEPKINVLVYDLMRNGNLDSVLHDYASRNEDPINWELRLRIALGVARGLSCLHYDCIPHIIHRDIKCSNILLDENMEAHVGDFGLAKFMNSEKTHVTTMAAGTFGYLPPEYLETGKITEKGYVYSFGVVLLELLTGKRPNDDDIRDHDFNIVNWANALVANNHPEDVFDENIIGTAPDEDLLATLSIALSCTNEAPKARPSMPHIVKMLQKLHGEESSSSSSLLNHTLGMGNQTHCSVRTSGETSLIYPCDVI